MGESLEFLLDLDAKVGSIPEALKLLDQAQEALDKTKKSIPGVTDEFDKLSKELKNLERPHKIEEMKKRIEELKNPTEKAEGALHRLVHAGIEPFLERAKQIAEFEFIRRGVDALIEAPEKLIEKVKELGEEILKAAAAEERNEAAFKNLFGDVEGKEQIEVIDQIGKHTEFTRNSLKNMTLELAQGGGFEGRGLVRAREAALDIASFSKNAEEGASRAISALNRINLSGKVEGRTLRGVGIKEDTFFGVLGKRIGLDAKSAKKAMDEGKVKTEDALEALNTAIVNRTKRKLGGAGADMEKLFSARLTHVKEIPEEIFEAVKDSRGFGQISDFLGELATKFGPDSEFGEAAKAGISSVFDELGDRLREVDLDGILNKGLDVLKQMPDFVSAVGQTFKDLWSAVQPIVGAFETVASIVDKIGPKQTGKDIRLEAQLRNPEVFEKERQLREQLALSRIAAKHGFKREQDPETRLAKVGEDSGTGMVKGLEKSAPAVSDAAGEHIGAAAEKGASKRLKRNSPSKVFEEIGMDVADGFAIGVQRGGVQDAIAEVVAPRRGRSPGAAAGGGYRIELHIGGIHITSTGALGHEIPQLVADKLQEITPGMIQSLVESLANQAGSA